MIHDKQGVLALLREVHETVYNGLESIEQLKITASTAEPLNRLLEMLVKADADMTKVMESTWWR